MDTEPEEDVPAEDNLGPILENARSAKDKLADIHSELVECNHIIMFQLVNF